MILPKFLDVGGLPAIFRFDPIAADSGLKGDHIATSLFFRSNPLYAGLTDVTTDQVTAARNLLSLISLERALEIQALTLLTVVL